VDAYSRYRLFKRPAPRLIEWLGSPEHYVADRAMGEIRADAVKPLRRPSSGHGDPELNAGAAGLAVESAT